MPDVGKVIGPEGPKDGFGRKDTSVDADKFKSEMRRRVDEVSQTDPDQQKKRKRREEEEEEQAAQAAAAPPPPPPPKVAAETAQKRKVQFNAAMKRAPKAPPPRFGSEAQGPPGSKETAPPMPSVQQESLAVGPPESEAPPPAFPQGQVELGPPPSAAPPTPTTQQPRTRQPPTAESTRPTQPPEQQREKEKPKEAKRPKAGAAPLPMEGMVRKKEETGALFTQEKKKLKVAEKKPVEEVEQVAPAVVPPPQVVAPTPKEKKEEEPTVLPETTQAAAPPALEIPLALPTETPPIPAYTHFPPQIAALFERMVGVMTVMNVSGLTETVVTLNAPQFASSVFFGSQIIIQEFSTAPKEFNIKFNGSPQAVALFQGNAQDLMAAFAQGNWGFRVHRLETGHLGEKPLFHRKGAVSGEKEEGQQGGT